MAAPNANRSLAGADAPVGGVLRFVVVVGILYCSPSGVGLPTMTTVLLLTDFASQLIVVSQEGEDSCY